MKISKLFHWLYAIIMLLPIFAIGVTCGYAIFNKNAYKSYYSENVNQSNLIEVTSRNQLEVGDKYKVETSTTTQSIINPGAARFYITNMQNFIFNQNISFNPYEADSFNFTYYTTNYIVFYKENSQLGVCNLSNIPCSFIFELIDDTFGTNVMDYVLPNTLFQYQYITNSFISEVFYYSIDKVQQSPLFNWAENSFLVTPFAYIVNLFSMPTNSPIVMLLSYWLAISIIWLVFDLIMYVPLLVHRWLDKGVLE